jgi:hypothetical protein
MEIVSMNRAIFTREQEATLKFQAVCVPAMESAREIGPMTAEFTAKFFRAVSAFGESELFARQAERCEAMDIQPERMTHCWQMFKSLNNEGLQTIDSALELIDGLNTEFEGIVKKAENSKEKVKAISKHFFDVTISNLVEVDIKKSDALELIDEIKNLVSQIEKNGVGDVPRIAAERLTLLKTMRSEKGRGAEKNIFPWKLAGVIALLIVLGLAFAIHCGIFGCSVSSRNSYIAAIIVVALQFWC